MATHSAPELEQAFIRYWRTGAVGEEWTRGGRSYAERRPITDLAWAGGPS